MTTREHAVGSGAPAEVFTDEGLRLLDDAALEVLADVGVSIPCGRARAALVARGARAEGARVWLPPELVRGLVATAPPRITLGARAAPPIETGHRPLITTDGCCVEIFDLTTGEKRGTTSEDVAAIARVVDAMPEIDFCWPAVSAQDRPADARGLHELYLAVANTGKHVQTVTAVEPAMARTAVAMALALCEGDEERLRREPPVSALLGTVTPLGNDAGTLEAGLEFAAAGVPVGFVTMPMGGSTTPITMAGSLVVGIAEALSAVAVVQAAYPGAPVFICLIPSVMDLKTGDFTGGAPEDTVMGAAAGQIGRFYGLPSQCGVNSSGAKSPSWQSALDDTTTTFLSLAAGVDMLTGVGMVAGGRIFSYDEMALAADALTQARLVTAGLDMTALGRPAAPAAPAAGPVLRGGARGGSSAVEAAHRRVAAILAEHRPPALRATTDAALRRLASIPDRGPTVGLSSRAGDRVCEEQESPDETGR